MSGSVAGAKKAKATIFKKYGANYYREMGAKGGKDCNPRKGFGTVHRNWFEKLIGRPSRAQLAGAKGGTISKRTKAIKKEV